MQVLGTIIELEHGKGPSNSSGALKISYDVILQDLIADFQYHLQEGNKHYLIFPLNPSEHGIISRIGSICSFSHMKLLVSIY